MKKDPILITAQVLVLCVSRFHDLRCANSLACRRAYYGRLRAYDVTVSKIRAKQSWQIMGSFIPRPKLQMLLKGLNKNLKINI